MTNEWDEWLTASLMDLSINDETFSEYITQLCSEETMEDGERREVIVEFLSEATDQPVEQLVDEMLRRNAEWREKARRQEEEMKQKALEAVKLQEREALQATISQQEIKPAKKQLSKEEKQARERLLAQYGYDLDEVVETADGEVEFIYKGKKDDKKSSSDEVLLPKNRNAEIVKQAEQAKRLQAQAEHQKQVQRNKELQEKQRLEKEKEKRRTMKKEKRRM
ncbi:uncharacterized protein SPPG_06266 [Spizellomyces punctatus DAOM BR117]|uniref:CCDC43 PWI-like domain-containing protein n=1 Tax=Spizellomyces punctatus (strain DAOM BR117) TaxID=645134 RepID=A0A0L0HCD9_SPIPD|nr:uncharacterized protein SPPG_06266 [Spizellomyces punctatus DAOM BR117]KNC98581.1 hypothetical protein SPPG_06266 [Spizellomyces punctatus DAOM BR117]|eukprot:XP_016606621.1 hypothetical protein SPPG_06266 [Spizellomyces punctatus DAOM BR117]